MFLEYVEVSLSPPIFHWSEKSEKIQFPRISVFYAFPVNYEHILHNAGIWFNFFPNAGH